MRRDDLERDETAWTKGFHFCLFPAEDEIEGTLSFELKRALSGVRLPVTATAEDVRGCLPAMLEREAKRVEWLRQQGHLGPDEAAPTEPLRMIGLKIDRALGAVQKRDKSEQEPRDSLPTCRCSGSQA